MRTYRYSIPSALVLVIAWIFFNTNTACRATSSGLQSPRDVVAGPGFAQPVKGDARLIVKRAPNLGANVGVQLSIDGATAASIGYGHTYRGSLAPGRHVLAVLATPSPRQRTPWQMTLDVQSGQTYSFTATRDQSGGLTLSGGLQTPRVH
jgi:hypothetical protein